MMANVAGVSQLLETVGTVGPQAAPQGAPGQNFAAVMQQTSSQDGSPLPVPFGSFAAQQNAQQQTEGSGAAGSAQQPTTAAESDALSQLGQRTNVGPMFADARGSGSAQVALGLKGAQTAVAANATGNVSGNVSGNGAAAVVAAQTGVPVAPVAVAPKIVAPVAGAEVAAPAEDAAVAVDVAAALKTLDAGGVAAQAAGTAKRVGEAKVALDERPVAKTGSGKADSKLTASIPQGTARVPQADAAGVLVAPMLVAAVAPVELPKTSALSQQGTGVGDTAVDLAASVAAPLAAAALAQGTGSKQVGTAKAGAGLELVQAGVPGTVDTAATKGLAKIDAAATRGSVLAGQGTAAAAPVAPQAGSVLEFAASLALAAQQAVAGTAVAAQTAVGQAVGAQATVAVAAPVEMADAKAGVHGGRNGLATASGLTAGTVTAGNTAAETAVTSGQTRVASTPVMSAVPVAAPVVTAPVAEAAVASPRVAMQEAGTAVAPVAAPVRAAGPVAAKALSLNGTGVAATAKDESVSGVVVAPAAAPVAAGPDAIAVVSVPVVVPVPLAHGTAASASVASTTAVAGGSVAEVEGPSGLVGGSLPHTTLSATPTSLEVGVSSGTHGWLKIRAELNEAGGVDASLTGATAEATSRLRGDLPALSTYLQDAKVSMGTLDVRSLHVAASSFESGAGFSQSGSGQGGAGQPGAGQNGASQQGAGQMGAAVSADAGAGGGQSRQGAATVPMSVVGVEGDKVLPGRMSDAAVYGSARELAGGEGSPSAGYGVGGGWLNVRA